MVVLGHFSYHFSYLVVDTLLIVPLHPQLLGSAGEERGKVEFKKEAKKHNQRKEGAVDVS